MSSYDYTVHIKKYEPQDPRLGRHVRHDSRSRSFAFTAQLDRSQLMSVRHYSEIPVLDQGNLGSCTGNSSVKSLSYPPLWTSKVVEVLSTTDTDANEAYAVGVYSDATEIDPWEGVYPPDDTGSDGLSVAKVLQSRGLISGYQHAFDLDALLYALQTQPVIVGTSWLKDMFYPENDGRIHATGDVQGGHEYCIDEIDVINQRVWIQNSWGNDWGIEGRAYLSWDDMDKLLQDYGDCTVFVPAILPAPEPNEPEPVPEPAPLPAGCLIGWLLGLFKLFKK